MDRAIRIAILVVLVIIAVAAWSIVVLLEKSMQWHTFSPDTNAVRVKVVP